MPNGSQVAGSVVVSVVVMGGVGHGQMERDRRSRSERGQEGRQAQQGRRLPRARHPCILVGLQPRVNARSPGTRLQAGAALLEPATPGWWWPPSRRYDLAWRARLGEGSATAWAYLF
jgi:hypothetical protein